MAEQFGPPLRFKAVNTETGEEWLTDKIVLSLSGELLPVIGGDTIQEPEDHADWLSEVVITQSTGLHDRNGVEIFGGDCLKQLGEDDFLTLVWCPVDLEFVCESELGSIRYINSTTSKESFTVIGNRWMPREELEKRAREVTDE